MSSREVRRVPANWEHPCDANGDYIPLHGGSFSKKAAAWDEENAKWERGEFPDYASEKCKTMTYAEYDSERPRPEEYMPDWPDVERTHYQMYETTTEGTPISPVFATPEEVAAYCADPKNDVSAWASIPASYEAWLRVAKGGWAPGGVRIGDGPVVDGVTAMAELEDYDP